MKPAVLLLLLPPACRSRILSDDHATLPSAAIYSAVTGTALARWGAELSKDHLQHKERTTRQKLDIELAVPKFEAAARAKLARARTVAARVIFRSFGYGTLLRGIESVLEQELNYIDELPSKGHSAKQTKRKRSPRVALLTAAAVVGLLASIEAPWAAGVAASLHLGFHGSGWLWQKLSLASK